MITRNRFLRYLGWAVLALVFYPLRALAKLEKPLSPYSWVFWSFPMKFSRSVRYSVSVRAADMYSGIQRDGQRDAFPAGVDGFHRIRFNVLLG